MDLTQSLRFPRVINDPAFSPRGEPFQIVVMEKATGDVVGRSGWCSTMHDPQFSPWQACSIYIEPLDREVSPGRPPLPREYKHYTLEELHWYIVGRGARHFSEHETNFVTANIKPHVCISGRGVYCEVCKPFTQSMLTL
jgi:hypothetical protein